MPSNHWTTREWQWSIRGTTDFSEHHRQDRPVSKTWRCLRFASTPRQLIATSTERASCRKKTDRAVFPGAPKTPCMTIAFCDRCQYFAEARRLIPDHWYTTICLSFVGVSPMSSNLHRLRALSVIVAIMISGCASPRGNAFNGYQEEEDMESRVSVPAQTVNV